MTIRHLHLIIMIFYLHLKFLYELAISNINGKTKFHLSSGDCSSWTNDQLWSKNDWSASSSLKEPKNHLNTHPWITFDSSVDVNCIRLDDFEPLKNKTIDFIWMDVQGAEDLVFQGATNTLKKTKYIFTEYDNGELYAGQLSLNDMINVLGPDWEVINIFENDVLLKNNNYENI